MIFRLKNFFAPISIFFVIAVALSLSACATKKIIVEGTEKPAVVYDSKPVSTLYGKASYYYGRWIGRLTANGETYRASDVTAAHKSLPFNTMVRVTNLKNGKTVIVRINNRGPYVKGRILDMSLVAAQRLEMTGAGVVPVKAEILKRIEPASKLKSAQVTKAKRSAEKAIEEKARAAEVKKSPATKPTPTKSAAPAPKVAVSKSQKSSSAKPSSPSKAPTAKPTPTPTPKPQASQKSKHQHVSSKSANKSR